MLNSGTLLLGLISPILEKILLPEISVLVPIRNEGLHIERCLQSILNQTLSPDLIEILVIDGQSTDQTREIVYTLQSQHPQIKLLDNPQYTVPYAINIGIQAAHGNVIVIVGGHSEIAPNYLELCVSALEQTGAGCVGGRLNNIGETPMARAIALGMSSPFGIGNARFRYSQTPGYVDTVAFGAYRREVIEKVGLFNEALTRNQDDEYNYRVRAAGYKIWLDPRIQANYYTRSTLFSLWKQYFQYGFWKVKVLYEHPQSLQVRHLVPGLFVLGLASGALLSLLTPWGISLLATILIPYLSLNLYFSLKQVWPSQWQYLPRLLLVFPSLHLSYGLGFLLGIPALIFSRQQKNFKLQN